MREGPAWMGRPSEVRNKFGSISKLIGIDPRGFFISAFVAHPLDKILKFAVMSVVNLGIKDVRNFEFGLVFDNEGQGHWLNLIRNSDSGMLVPTLRHGIPGVLLRGHVGVVG